jgi:hypothetical protein
MAVVNTNTEKILRFDDGGKIIITPEGSSDDYAVLLVEAGSVNLGFGVRATMPHDIDRGQLLDDTREGDEQPSTLTFNVKHTGGIGATDLLTMLNAEGDDGYLPKFSIDVEWYDSSARTTGTRYPMTNAVRAAAAQIIPGAEYDQLQVSFTSPNRITPEAISA